MDLAKEIIQNAIVQNFGAAIVMYVAGFVSCAVIFYKARIASLKDLETLEQYAIERLKKATEDDKTKTSDQLLADFFADLDRPGLFGQK